MSTGVPVAGDPVHVEPRTRPPPEVDAPVVAGDAAVVADDAVVVLDDAALEVVDVAALVVADDDFEELPQALMNAPATATDTSAGNILVLLNMLSQFMKMTTINAITVDQTLFDFEVSRIVTVFVALRR